MSYWDNLSPTPKQEAAIKDYNKAYGVKIHAYTKQAAHNIISIYCPVQMLEFGADMKVKGTDIYYEITNEKLFKENPRNKFVKDNVVNVKVKNGIAYITMKKKDNTLQLLKALQKNMDERLEFPSFDKVGDDLGFLSPQELEEESDMYGSDPIWWK
jgi:hypothetical protein